jgi:antirestriction protein ArdC
MTNKVHDLITERILTQPDNGVVPWRKPWGLQPGLMPMNGTNNREYQGINALMLGLSGYADLRWMTYKQAAEHGAQVRKGEKSTPIIFWKQSLVQDTNDAGETVTKTIPMLRCYAVFNVEQIDGLKLPKLVVQENTFNAMEQAEAVITNMPQRPSIDHDGRNRAYYTPSRDSIHLRPQSAFETPDEYYSTLFHELGHSTGHESRLNRHGTETGIAPFGSPTYSKEELAAEFTACFLCHLSGITNTTDNSADYISGWASKLRSDRKLVLQGASQGQKAADFILGSYRPLPVTARLHDLPERSLEDKLADLYPVRS